MKLKLDPRQRLKQWVNGEVIVTNDPVDYPEHVAELLLQSRRNGLPLVTEVEDEEPAQPWSLTETGSETPVEHVLSSDDEDAEAEAETSDDD